MSTIYVLDDVEDINFLFASFLRLFGYSVKTAVTSEELFFHFDKGKPDILFLDVMLSGEDGRELCKKFNTQYPSLPIVLMSASKQKLENFKECGAVEELEKPFDIDDVIRLINKWVK